MTKMLGNVWSMLAAAGMAAMLAMPASAAQTITIKVGYPAGGGFDFAGRITARHLGRFLEGNPTIVVQNVPGGGSLKLTEMLQDSEPGDGSVIGVVGPTMATAPLLDPALQHLKPDQFRWIGSLRNEASVCFTGQNSGVETLEDFRTKEILLGASGKASTTYLHAALVKNLLGAKFTIVTGFQGTSDIDAAIERGEITGRCSASYSSIRSTGLIDRINVIVTVHADEATDAAEVPLLSDFASSQIDRDAAEIITGTLTFHLPLMLPSSATPDVVERYRAAFDEMVRDPEFLADAARFQTEIDAKSGARIEEISKSYYALPPETVARARELIE